MKKIWIAFSIAYFSLSLSYAQNVSIKIVFQEPQFSYTFQQGQPWYGVNIDNVKTFIVSRVTDDFQQFGIPVSTTSGVLVAYVGVFGGGFGNAVSGIGSYINGSAYCEIYCDNFAMYTEWTGSNATVERIGEAIAGTTSHELAHLLNCYHAYMFEAFDPTITNAVDNQYYPREPEDLPLMIREDDGYPHIMATRDFISNEQRAMLNRYFSSHSSRTINFANSGGCYVNANMVWGIRGKTFSLLNDIEVAVDAKFYIAGDGYTHNLNGKTFSGGSIYQSGSIGGLAAKVKTGSTIKGLFPTIQPAITFAPSGNTVEISSGSFNESISLNSKQGITIVGQGVYSTLLNNQISLSSSSNITLDNFRASGGVQLNGGTGNTIQNCKIESIGIYLYNSSPTITGNTIQYCGDGIYADYFSSPALTNNLIQSNSYGIRCNSGSSPNLSSQYQNSNVIRNNSNDAVYAVYGSNPNLGSGSNGRNSFYGNGTPAISAVYSSSISAMNNWWGTTPPLPPSMFYEYYGTINHSSELQSNPNYSINTTDENSPVGIQANLSYKSVSDDISTALDMQKDKKYDEAIPLFLEVFKNNKDALLGKYALSKIEECFTQAGKKDYLDYSKKEIKPLLKNGSESYVVALELETHQMVNLELYKDAVNNLQTILKKYNLNNAIEKNTLFNLGAFYTLYFGDKDNSDKYFEELKQKYPDDDLVNQIEIVRGLGLAANSSVQSGGASTPLIETTPAVKATVSEDAIINYPNPFNPSTRVSFSLKESGKVSLKVYDVLGKEVANLADGYYEAGKHTAIFDGSNLASGIYFYSLITPAATITKKMVLTK